MNDPVAPETNASVMASAGTGKTWLLVTRLVRLLLAGTKPDAILAITFTRKAAAEMQTRLNERLYDLASADDGTLDRHLTAMGIDVTSGVRDTARGLYEELLRARRPVRTTTFHAFCQEVLRRFPLEADVPPGFELVDQTGELERAAWDALMADATAHPDGELGGALGMLLDHYGQQGLEQALMGFLGHRSDWWAYSEGQPDPVGHALRKLENRLGTDTEKDPRAALLSEPVRNQLLEFAALLSRHPTKQNAEHTLLLTQALDGSPGPEEGFARLCPVFLTKNGEPRSRKASKTAAGALGEDGQARLLELHEHLARALLETRDILAAQDTLRTTGAWYLAGSRLLHHFQRIKTEQRLLDFADLEWKTYRLLTAAENAHWVQYKLDQRIDHLLVDEFQDTNPTQWRLLLPLLEEMAAGTGERRRSVFLVGDTKQSIYRFRRADPRLFAAAHDWLAKHLDASRHVQQRSWRSAPAVIEVVNRVFSNPSLKDRLADFVPHATHHEDLWGRVELLPLVTPEEKSAGTEQAGLRDPLRQPRALDIDHRHRREGELISARIRELVEGDVLVGGAGQARPIGYGDIIILVRSRAHVNHYEAALRAAGVPYTGADRGTLLDSLEVRDMVSLLETLITPYDNLALACVLRSPLFGCSDEDLQALALAGKTSPWFERLERIGVAASSPDAPLGRAASLLPAWRALAGRIPIHDLLDRVYSEGNLLARYETAFPGHLAGRARSNLVRFIELALEIDSGRYPSLTRFLSRLRELRANAREAPDEAPSGDGERVRIMTIHGAKGLEAPAVFLADTASPPPPNRPYRVLVDWPAGGRTPENVLLVGRKSQQDPFTRAVLETERQEEERESANLLYVALTRARQLLFISGCAPGRGTDLGWYGQIAAALAPGEESPPDQPVVVESGAKPRRPTGATPLDEEKPSLFPEALIQPPRIPPPLREIAPSRTAAGSAVAGEGDEDGRLRGIAIHLMLEHLAAGSQDGRTTLSRTAHRLNLDESDARLRRWWQEARAVFTNPALQTLFDPAQFEGAYCEVPIQYEQSGQTVYGIVDRLVLTRDEAWVIDYKSHRQSDANLLPQLADTYREQMALYAEGVRRLWPDRTIRAFLLFTASGELLELGLE